jgi:uncharacterized cupin superfamily protein
LLAATTRHEAPVMREPEILTAALDTDVELAPYDLPAEALIAGDPKPRLWSVTCEDGNGHSAVTGVFEADPGTIRNQVRSVETIHVLKGRVRIELDTGHAVELGAGEIAVLPRGPVATWTFLEPFREFFVLSGVPG